MEFEKFDKIPRLSRDMVVTEKIDGTNAQICIDEAGGFWVGSRSRWLTLEQDNFGFCMWASHHAEELREVLGVGRHYGEWWGQGIQRKYGLDEKRFSLFNTGRWNDDTKPDCCHVVPVLFEGPFCVDRVDDILKSLDEFGSRAADGFDKPEGVVIWHTHARVLMKKTLDKNDEHKSVDLHPRGP